MALAEPIIPHWTPHDKLRSLSPGGDAVEKTEIFLGLDPAIRVS
jgi:hypothetical protein